MGIKIIEKDPKEIPGPGGEVNNDLTEIPALAKLFQQIHGYQTAARDANLVSQDLAYERFSAELAAGIQKGRADRAMAQTKLLVDEASAMATKLTELREKLNRSEMRAQELEAMNEHFLEAIDKLRDQLKRMLPETEFELAMRRIDFLRSRYAVPVVAPPSEKKPTK